MKKLIYFILVSGVLPLTAFAQSGTWTWMKGSNTTGDIGIHGVMGVPSPTNNPPSRYACSHWTDTSGNFWIYGADYEDLWKFDPLTVEWTWMNGDSSQGGATTIVGAPGVYNAGNQPGATFQGKCTWVTSNNHLWLLGDGNNLWQYDPAINQWAWMGATGPVSYGTEGLGTLTTLPGDRLESSTAWVDTSGNLWMFGGLANGFDLNDMWQYNVSSGIWTWMSGTNLNNNNGTYGVMGVPSTNNIPPARSSNIAWSDNNGNFWLAGGEQISTSKYYNDVWEFNPQTLEWTWIAGPQGSNNAVSSGTSCDTAASNKEGKRWENRALFKICDNLILNYSGSPSGNYAASLNDLWAWIPSLGEWMLLTSASANGNYGVQGVSSPTNSPPGRVGAVGSVDKTGTIWMFGGDAITGGWVNDLWKYMPDSACIALAGCVISAPFYPLQAVATASNASCSDSCNGSAIATASSGTPPYQYLWSPGSYTTSSVTGLCAGQYLVQVSDANGSTVTDTVTVTAPAPPVVMVSSDTNGICSGDTAIICATDGFNSYYWNSGQTTSCIDALESGNYYVSVSDSSGCTALSNSLPLIVYQSPIVSISQSGDTLIVYNAAQVQWYFNGAPINGATSSTYIATQQGYYQVMVTDSNGCSAVSSRTLVSGIHQIISDEISIYPNPLESGNWKLNVSSRLVGTTAKIFDAAGRLVHEFKIASQNSELDLNVAGGIYFLRIEANDKQMVFKLIKL